ncbi:MAG: ABC transporter permease, partial [Xanthomonadales bacterium]|nr:ABC transporter permease [Xanthomonadales bacterium]
FAPLRRAPEAIAERIREIPGVGIVETRVTAFVTLQMADYDEPVRGYILSLPQRHGSGGLNRLYLRAGRLPQADRDDEIVIGEAFAEHHGLVPGDRLEMILYGKKVSQHIVGIALSPEFVYQVGPGELIPDFKRFGIGWMEREPLAQALDLDGAFNDLVATLSPTASEDQVLEKVDLVLARWGGTGAYGRENQQSHRFLNEEFKQLTHMGRMFSFIFLGISAFLLHMVVGRLIDTQREQIAVLKAFGYSNAQVGLHYAKLVVAIVLLGTLAGVAAGAWLGHGLAGLYMDYYRIPHMVFNLRPQMALSAMSVTALAALAGAASAVWRGVRLPPAEAMRPEPPARFRATIVERMGLQRFLSPANRMVLRQMERRPVRALMTVLGVALATGIMVSGIFFPDSMDFIVDAEFHRASREDLAVSFIENTERRALFEIAALPGVRHAEPFRSVGIKLRKGNRERRTVIQGLAPGAELHRVLDARLQAVELPPDGLLLSDVLATVLDIRPGDRVSIETLEGRRGQYQVNVVGIIEQWIGMSAYMDLDALNRLTGEGDVISGAYLDVETHRRTRLLSLLEDRPRVAGTRSQAGTIQSWHETFEEVLLTFVGFISAMAGAITLGVVYNAARITLSERARELASLRVLGFTRGEISQILLGELSVLVLAAIPAGFVIGAWLSYQWAAQAPAELFKIPVVLSANTFALSATVVLIAAMFSALIVRQKLNHLDLIRALKTKE